MKKFFGIEVTRGVEPRLHAKPNKQTTDVDTYAVLAGISKLAVRLD